MISCYNDCDYSNDNNEISMFMTSAHSPLFDLILILSVLISSSYKYLCALDSLGTSPFERVFSDHRAL